MNVSVARANSPIDQRYSRPVNNRIAGRTKTCKIPKISPTAKYEKTPARGWARLAKGTSCSPGTKFITTTAARVFTATHDLYFRVAVCTRPGPCMRRRAGAARWCVYSGSH